MSRRYLVRVQNPYQREDDAGEAQPSEGAVWVTTEWLEAVRFSHTSNGEMGQARLIGAKQPNDALPLIPFCTRIEIIDTKNVAPTDPPFVVFDGVVWIVRCVEGAEQAHFEIIAYNRGDDLLERIHLHGQHRLAYDNEQTYFDTGATNGAITLDVTDLLVIDTELCFNPGGLPNMSDQHYQWSGEEDHTWHIFEYPQRKQVNDNDDELDARPWTLREAIGYLLHSYKVKWAIDPASFTDTILDAVFDANDPDISNVNLEGLTMAQALDRLLSPHNYIYSIDPEPINNTENNLHYIRFWERGKSTNPVVDLQLSAPGTNAHDSTANVLSLDLKFDATPTINALDGYGDRKKIVTLAHTNPPTVSSGPKCVTLVKGWKDEDLNWVMDDKDPTKVNTYDPNFAKNMRNKSLVSPDGTNTPFGVGRLWLVNMGERPDIPLEDIGTDLGADCTLYPRRLEKPHLWLNNSAAGLLSPVDITLEISVDGGDHWGVVERNQYRLYENGMGIYFEGENLEMLGMYNPGNEVGKGYWQALYEGTLQLRVICTVKADERLHKLTANDGAVAPLARGRSFVNDGYRKIEYSTAINGTVYYTDYPPSTLAIDDTTALQNLVGQQLANTNRPWWSGTVVRILDDPNLSYDLSTQPGHIVTEIANRSAYHFSPPATVIRVEYLLQDQHVHLILDNRKVQSVLRTAKPTHAIPGVNNQLGTKVDWLPGTLGTVGQHWRAEEGGN